MAKSLAEKAQDIENSSESNNPIQNVSSLPAETSKIPTDQDYNDSFGHQLKREVGHVGLSAVEGVNLGWASKYLADFNLPQGQTISRPSMAKMITSNILGQKAHNIEDLEFAEKDLGNVSNPDLTLLALVMNGGRNATNILYNKFLNQPNINLND